MEPEEVRVGSAPLPILLLDTQIHTVSEQEVMANSEGAEHTDLGSNPSSSSNSEIFHF